MNWVRIGAAAAALGLHVALAAVLIAVVNHEPDLAALQSGDGKDELSVVATISMMSEESLGLDSSSTPRRDDPPGGRAVPQVKEVAVKEDEKIEAPVEEREAPPPVEEKKPEKKVDEQVSISAPASEAEEEQRAASRAYEARRNRAISLYNSSIYQSLMRNALRPKIMEKGRVVLELTLSPSGELIRHRVVESSGSEVLDKVAMISLERAAPFPPIPSEAGRDPYTLRVPFEYAAKW
jgi:periplasmic protein TonB